MDVETGVVRASVSVDGTYTKLFIAQAELAKKLVIAIQGAVSDAQRKNLASEDRSIEAFQAFSDGLLFLRKNLPADALNSSRYSPSRSIATMPGLCTIVRSRFRRCTVSTRREMR